MLNDNQKAIAVKRIADASEKFAVGAFVVAAFQGSILAAFLGIFFLGISITLSIRGQ